MPPKAATPINTHAAFIEAKAGSWDAFYERVRPILMDALRGVRLPSDFDAEDVIQMTMYEALIGIDSWVDVNPRAWICSILRNTVIDGWRKYNARKRTANRAMSLNDVEAVGDIEGRDIERPSAIARFNEMKAALDVVMKQLKPEYLEILRLREAEGTDYAELAALLNLTESGARARVLRARRRRAELLSRMLPDLPIDNVFNETTTSAG